MLCVAVNRLMDGFVLLGFFFLILYLDVFFLELWRESYMRQVDDGTGEERYTQMEMDESRASARG